MAHQKRVALVTGSSRGLGLAIAQQLVARGFIVILNGRDTSRLKTAAATFKSGEVATTAGDVAAHAFAANLTKTLKALKIDHIDLVVHNAGINHMGNIKETKPANAAETLRVNALSVIHLAQAARALLEKSADPRFVLVSSLMQYFAMPARSVYAASKASAELFVGAWELELKAEKSPIRVQIFRPAGIETGFHANTKTDGDSPRSEVSRMPPEKVAAELMKLIDSTRRELAPGFMNRIVAFVARHFPALTRRLMLRRHLKSLR